MKNRSYSKMVSIFSLVIAIATSLWFALPATLCYAQGGYAIEEDEVEVEPHPGLTSFTGKINVAGALVNDVTAKSPDNLCQLTLNKGTKALDKTGNPLSGIVMVEEKEPPAPPADASTVSLTYDMGPDGATFDPAITLTFTYDPDKIPHGINEEDLVIAIWDKNAGKWIELEDCIVDPVNNTISAPVSHFTAFTIIARATPEPPAPPTPATFLISNLTVQPTEVQPKTEVTITASVTNTGDIEGSYNVVLKMNDVKEAEESVTVAAGSSKVVTFSVTREKADSYSVTVDGLSASFTVVAPPVEKPLVEEPPVEELPEEKPANDGWLIGGIIAAVIVIGVISFLIVRRRIKS
ncbi:CARDB domain-containing protein [Chloroflexota bacterium]